MAGLIPQPFIDDLIDRVDIVDVVNARVKLKKAGKNYTACCPFHNEKTPSFTVSPQKQFYYCFGCGAAGNAIGFVMEYDHVDFPSAVEILAHQTGMTVPRESKEPDRQHKKRNDIYSTLRDAEVYFRNELSQSAQAISYIKSRGISGSIARDFALGFAPNSWESLTAPAKDNAEQTRLLEEGGMIIRRDDENNKRYANQLPHYDRFRYRIMFPIRDQRGRTVAFGGRVLGDDKPKYLNSPETPAFQKSRELYGLYEMLQSAGKPTSAVVVEGYMDVVALAQHDIRNAVATLGTSIGQPHLEKLFRHVSQVIFCFDGDAAGRRAAERALDACLPVMLDGRQASFLFLADGEDPDTIVQAQGKDAFLSLAQDATTLTDFVFQQAGAGLTLNTDDENALLAHRALPMIQKVPQGLLHQMMMRRLSDQTSLSIEQLLSSVPPPAKQATTPPRPKPAEPSREEHLPVPPPSDDDARLYDPIDSPPNALSGDLSDSPFLQQRPPSPYVQRMLSIVLQAPDLSLTIDLKADYVVEVPAAERDPGIAVLEKIQNAAKQYPNTPYPTLSSFFTGLDPNLGQRLDGIFASDLLTDTPMDYLEKELDEVTQRWQQALEKQTIKSKISELEQTDYEDQSEQQRTALRQLHAQFRAL